MRLSSLAGGMPDWQLDGDAEIREVVYDSRLAGPGALFVALRGGYADGHDYVAKAIDAGASACMVEERLPVAVPQVLVLNRIDLAGLPPARHWR